MDLQRKNPLQNCDFLVMGFLWSKKKSFSKQRGLRVGSGFKEFR